MNSFKEKEKKYKYKFFKAVVDKDYKKIPTYVQKYLEYCTDSDIKNIFNKKNDLYGGSFNDDEKKYKYKFFKAVSDKNYKKLSSYVLKYAEHTRDHDVKNMFDHLVQVGFQRQERNKLVLFAYQNSHTQIESHLGLLVVLIVQEDLAVDTVAVWFTARSIFE